MRHCQSQYSLLVIRWTRHSNLKLNCWEVMNQKKKKWKIDVNKRIRNYFTDWKSSYYPKLFVITFYYWQLDDDNGTLLSRELIKLVERENFPPLWGHCLTANCISLYTMWIFFHSLVWEPREPVHLTSLLWCYKGRPHLRYRGHKR